MFASETAEDCRCHNRFPLWIRGFLWGFGFWWASNVSHEPWGRLIRFAWASPPLAKQKRIVAEVDALMALVDPFEQQLDDSRAAAELTVA